VSGSQARAPRTGRAPRFPCARCGRLISRTTSGKPLKIGCSRCQYLIYDYPRPCSGTIVLKGDTVLVLRRAHRPRIGYLDFPGGFLEANESIEGGARRELLEETGLTVGRLAWFGFYWDRYFLKGFGTFPTMNFYYLARWRAGTPIAADDAASAEWMPVAQLGRAHGRLAWTHMAQVVRDLRARLRTTR